MVGRQKCNMIINRLTNMSQMVTTVTSVRKVCSSNLDWVTINHASFIQALLTIAG